MGKRELDALLNLSSWCLVVVGQLFLVVPKGCQRFVIVVFPDHTHYFLCSKGIRPHFGGVVDSRSPKYSYHSLFSIKGHTVLKKHHWANS